MKKENQKALPLLALLLAGAVVFALDLLQRRRRVDWA